METIKQEQSFEEYLNLRFDAKEDGESIDILNRIHEQLKEGSITIKTLRIKDSRSRHQPQSGKTTLIKKLLTEIALEVLTCRDSEIPSKQFSSYEDLFAYMKEHDDYVIYLSHKDFATHKHLVDDCFNLIHQILVLSQQKNSLVIFEDWNNRMENIPDSGFRFLQFFPLCICLDLIPVAYQKYHLQILPLTKKTLAFLLEAIKYIEFGDFHSLVDSLKLFSKQEINNLETIQHHLRLYRIYLTKDEEKHGLQSITGRSGLKAQIHEIIAKYKMMERLKQMGVPLFLYYIFDGPPGTGKTFAVKCLAEELDMEITRIELSKIEGGFAKCILEEISEKQKGAIIFIDEIDKCLGKHTVFDKVSSMEGEFQQLIDGIGSFKRLFKGIFIVNTNEAWRLSESLRDRFQVITFSLPDEEDRKQFFEEKLEHLDEDLKNTLKQSFSLDGLASKTAGKSYREMNRLWTDVVLQAIRGDFTFQQTAFEAKEQIAYVG